MVSQVVVQEGVRVERLPVPGPGAPGPFGIVGAAGPAGDVTFEFVAGEMSLEGRVVTNAPYSAEAVTETQQVLTDGNRITRRNTATIYRDSEGRTRREMSIGAIGPWASRGESRQTVFINDPVAGVNYVLDPQERTARKMTMPRREEMRERMARARSGMQKKAAAPANRPQPRVESLGKQMIEGVEAEGTRTTITIPAGEIGNERPIEIVSERWFSRDLQTVVMTRRSDPRMGETTYKLTNIRRTEPLRSMFEPPPDYTVKEGPEFDRRMRGPGPGQE
jgi:hypothetical protein